MAMTKATPHIRSGMHNEHVQAQISSIKESNTYQTRSPIKVKNHVLEERVFKTPSKFPLPPKKLTGVKHRAQTAKKQADNCFGISPYANPAQRPQISQKKGVNKEAINTRIQSSSKQMQRALGIGNKKQSQFMEKVNQPLLRNQTTEDLVDALMQLLGQERHIE